jgi:putative spermidine/putrescine transport system substrate-binding protein
MSDKKTTSKGAISRRTLMKTAAGAVGAAAGTGVITGFPYIRSAEPKVLRYLGTAVNQSDDITKKVLADTGITIQNIVATTDDVTKKVVTQPDSFDVLDTEYFSLKKLVPSGNILSMDASKIKEFNNITPIFTKGELPNGKKIGDQGTAPKKVMFVEGEGSSKFSATPTQWVTLIPTVYNADTLGIRPDLIKRPISSWAELLNPEFKGKAAILDIPSIGIMDAAMVVEAMGKYKYPDKGNMTKAEIDMTTATLIEAKKAGQFRAFWKDVPVIPCAVPRCHCAPQARDLILRSRSSTAYPGLLPLRQAATALKNASVHPDDSSGDTLPVCQPPAPPPSSPGCRPGR